QCRDLGLAELRPLGGQVEAAVASQTRKHDVFEAERRRRALRAVAGADVTQGKLRLGDLPTSLMVLADPLGGGREFGQRLLGAGRSLDQIAPAVRAMSAQASSGAVRAERALEGADQGVGRAVGQVLVAAFAVRAEIE